MISQMKDKVNMIQKHLDFGIIDRVFTIDDLYAVIHWFVIAMSVGILFVVK